jgi:hypothetical protein
MTAAILRGYTFFDLELFREYTLVSMKNILAAIIALLFVQAGKANLEGVVTGLDGKQPVAGARLTLRLAGAPRNAPTPTAMTNAQGRFSFTGLNAGTYSIQAEATGHVPQPSAAQVELTAGQTTRDVVIRLTAVATISGRIRDPQGMPVVDIPVQLIQSSYTFDGKRTFRSAGTVRTNDRGEYRIYWVTPGRYHLLAGSLSTGSNIFAETMQQVLTGTGANGTPVARVRGYVFFPGLTEFGSARPLDLLPGADLQGVDLTVTPNPPAFRITGRVIDSRTGQAPPRASVGLTHIPEMDLERIAVTAGDVPNQNYNPATGTFEVRDVLPGAYVVTATTGNVTGRGVSGTGSVAVSVSDKDVEGVAVSINPYVTVSGRLRVEGNLPPKMPFNCLRIALVPLATSSTPLSPFRAESGQCNQVAADGTLTINNVPPGEYGLAVYGFPVGGASANSTYIATLVGNGFLKEALFQGLDVLNNPLRVGSDRNGPLDIVIAMGGGKIEGTLTDAILRPLPSRRVVLVPDRGRFQWQLYRSATTNGNGQFSMSVLAPGSYRLYAWETMEEYAWFDPEILKRYEPLGRPVRVTETSSETVDLRIIPAEGAR